MGEALSLQHASLEPGLSSPSLALAPPPLLCLLTACIPLSPAPAPAPLPCPQDRPFSYLWAEGGAQPKLEVSRAHLPLGPGMRMRIARSHRLAGGGLRPCPALPGAP